MPTATRSHWNLPGTTRAWATTASRRSRSRCAPPRSGFDHDLELESGCGGAPPDDARNRDAPEVEVTLAVTAIDKVGAGGPAASRGEVVGAVGFEPTTSCSQSMCAARLRSDPTI